METLTKTDNWFFEDDSDKELGIETLIYDNQSKVKRAKLSDGKTLAVARELKGRDMKQVDRICNGKKDEYLPALMITAVKSVDESGAESNWTLEELDDLKGKDYTTIKVLATTLNF